MKTYRIHFTCSKGVNCIIRVKAVSRSDAKVQLIAGWDVYKIRDVYEISGIWEEATEW